MYSINISAGRNLVKGREKLGEVVIFWNQF